MRTSFRNVLFLFFAGASACTGSIGVVAPGGEGPSPGNGGPVSGANSGGSANPGVGVVPPGNPADPGMVAVPPGGSMTTPPPIRASSCTGVPLAGTAPLRRLTRDEYDRTLRDLVGDTSNPSRGFLGDEKVGRFDSNAAAPVSDLAIEKYATAAESVAGNAAMRLAMQLPCAASGDDSCAQSFIVDFGRRVYRRPLTTEEVGRYRALFTMGRTGATFSDGLRLIVTAMLQSPHFLYHVELGEVMAGTLVARLNSFEIAARLAYYLWGTTPDAALMKLAESGSLLTPEAIDKEARRMLAAAPASETVGRFHLQWLGVDHIGEVQKDGKVFGGWTAELQNAMRTEVARFGDWAIREGDGKMNTLFTAPVAFASGPLFSHYGLKDPGGTAGPDGSKRVAADPKQRRGILTTAAVMSVTGSPNQSNPVLRGQMVRSAVLCQELPSPPANVNTSLPAIDPKVTTRERFRQHRQDPTCAGCHQLLDPVGLAFENYDLVGRYRTMDGVNSIDATGEFLTGPADLAGTFNGAIELMEKLTSSQSVKECLATQWTQFALGRPLGADDACALSQASQAFNAAGGDLRELVVAVAKSDGFRYRKVQP